MKNLLLLFPLVLLMSSAKSQSPAKSRGALAVSVGAAANYYYGPGDRNFGKFENDRVNWQINGMLGITLARDKGDRRTILGAFGSFGVNNASTISDIFEDQGYVKSGITQSTNNNFYQLEGGLLIAETIRISTGVGQQLYDKQILASPAGINFDATSLKYNSTTIGLNLNAGPVGIVINCNFNYGRDYTKTVINPSAGLNFRF